LRGRAIRWAIGKSALGTIFLIGALSYAFGPAPTSSSSRLWMTLLVVLSTFHMGLGLRTFAKVRRRALRLWWVGAVVWAGLATILLRLLSGS
jgi:succinate dehydrogenase hydrophobic anchor subunit